MDGDKQQGKRISTEQREVMLNFMMEHPSLATGKFTGLDGPKQKQRLLNEMALQLNAHPTGVTKTPDKWYKSWQDWRSDVKSKAPLIKKKAKGTGEEPGGGKINPKTKPLSPLEDRLLGMLGPNIVNGHDEVPDSTTLAVIAANETDQQASTSTASVKNIGIEIAETSASEPQIFYLPLDSTLSNITVTTNAVSNSSEENITLENPTKKRKLSRNRSSSAADETGDLQKLLSLTEKMKAFYKRDNI